MTLTPCEAKLDWLTLTSYYAKEIDDVFVRSIGTILSLTGKGIEANGHSLS